MGRDETRGPSKKKKALNRQIFIVYHLHVLETKHLYAALCSTGNGALTVVRKLHRQLPLSGKATLLKNGFVKPSGSSQKDGTVV